MTPSRDPRGLVSLAQRPHLHPDDSTPADRRPSSVVGAGVWTMIAVASNGVARLVAVILVGRATGVDALGEFQTGLSIAQLMVLFLPTALGSAASKFVAQARVNQSDGNPGDVFGFLARRLRLAALTLSLASAVVCLAVADGRLFSAVEVAVLTGALCWYSMIRGMLFGLGLARRAAFWEITTSVCTVAFVAALAGFGRLDHGAVLAVAAPYVIFAVMNMPRGESGSLTSERRREIDRFCVAVVFGTLASTGFLQLTMIASRVVGGVEAAGQFAAALNFATPVALIGASLSLVLFPELAGALSANDHSRVARLVDRAFRLLLILTVPVFVVTQFAAEFIIRVVLGEGFSEASAVLVILVAAVMTTTVGIPCVAAMTSGGQGGVRASAMLSGAGLACGLASWAVLVPLLHVDGVAWGYLCGSGLIAAAHIGWAWRAQKQKWVMPVASTFGAVLALAVIGSPSVTDAGIARVAGASLICLGWAALQVPFIRGTLRRAPRGGRS